jgi:hypothetical protein
MLRTTAWRGSSRSSSPPLPLSAVLPFVTPFGGMVANIKISLGGARCCGLVVVWAAGLVYDPPKNDDESGCQEPARVTATQASGLRGGNGSGLALALAAFAPLGSESALGFPGAHVVASRLRDGSAHGRV